MWHRIQFKYILSTIIQVIMQRGFTNRLYDPPYSKHSQSRISASIDNRPLSHSNFYQTRVQSPEPNYQYMRTAGKPKQNKMNLIKSKISLSQAHNQRLNENSLFPQELLFLLSEEQKNIEYFKERIEGEKKKVQRDFENFQKQISLLIDDLKLSFLSQLDQVYRDFINMYRLLKDSVTQMRQLRKNILNSKSNFNLKNQYDPNLSNLQLLQEISHDAQYFKNHQIYEEVNTAHRQKLGPVIEISNELIVVGGYDKFFYNESDTAEILRDIKVKFQGHLNEVYSEHLQNLIVQTEEILHNDKREKEENNMLLKGINDQSREDIPDYNYLSRVDKKHMDVENKRKSMNDPNPYGFNLNSKKNQTSKKQKKNRPSSSTEMMRFGAKFGEMVPNRENESFKNSEKKPLVQVTTTQQNLITDWAQQIQLQSDVMKNHELTTLQPQDALLCGVFLGKGYFAVGSKDKNIYIYSIGYKKLVSRLCGHKASVCCLMNHPQFLVSGGDVGCNSLILWDNKTWTVRSKIQAHSAAISGIVDLLDDQSLAVSSYDKKITIYNYRRGQIVFNVMANKTAVACLAIDSTTRKLISGGLDNHLSVWNIMKRGGRVESLQIDKVISNCGLVCSLREVYLEPNLIIAGNKEGKILIVNVKTGEVERRFTVGKSSVIEMVVVQRRNKPQTPLVITSCHRDRAMMATKTDTGLNRVINMKGRLNIDYGCGIGPKIVLSGDEMMMGIVSQSSTDREVGFYKININ